MTAPEDSRARGRRWLGGIVLSIAVVVAVAGGWLWNAVHSPADRQATTTVHFVVPEGATVRQVAEDLAEEGLLRRPWTLRLLARLDTDRRPIRAGEFELSAAFSPAEVLETLVAGPLLTRAITLPEGWTAARTVEALSDSLGVDAGALQALVDDPPEPWRQRLGIPEGQGLEGYLFPETYRFAKGVKPGTILTTLVGTLGSALDDSMRAALARGPYDLHQVLTLASIVEAEATRDDERSRVAAVYLNRLEQGWKLEADPTVAYAAGKIGERLLYRDLEIDSPYNTYRVQGLPPGPINSPGIASIRAVLEPEPDFDAMYFVADGEGGHVFSRTWEEHRSAVERYRRLQRSRGRDGSG